MSHLISSQDPSEQMLPEDNPSEECRFECSEGLVELPMYGENGELVDSIKKQCPIHGNIHKEE
jgi:hypothetical protein